MKLLEFQNIKKRFKRFQVLNNVSFNIQSGEIFGLVGRSGSGKTTLLKILMGMSRPDYGSITFEDKNVLRRPNYLRERTGYATQENMLFGELSIKENSFYFGDLYGVKKSNVKITFDKLINLLGLTGFEDTYVDNLSGGMKKRANILVSLIHSPKLLMLDEPTVGLDSLLRKTIWDYIHQINKSGTTIFVTSHLLEEIEENCDRIAILKRGKIVAIATPKEYRKAYGNRKPFKEIFEEMIKDESI
ncbi:MAG: ABC transporter ATP-binding protein [Nanoarchaeota archaeon]|nr:ABC transporter ATP-binding protein [Nanoarchaeota archaeon]